MRAPGIVAVGLAVLVLAILAAIWQGMECSRAGGVLVKGQFGYVCVAAGGGR